MLTTDMLSAYFDRIGYGGPAEPTLAVLQQLHALHPTQIPFEAIDPFLGNPVNIELEAIHAKLVGFRRGGYCHEQNTLFHDVLAAIGFEVSALGGRVVWMSPERDAPLTHRLALVKMAEGTFTADVGFGGQTPTAPLQFEVGLAQETPHGTFRITNDGTTFATEMWVGDRWEPMYRYTLTPQSPADFMMANWFTSTHPRGRFTNFLVVACIVGEARVNLFNATLTTRGSAGATVQRTLAGPEELGSVLEDVMGLTLPVAPDVIWAKLPKEKVPFWPSGR